MRTELLRFNGAVERDLAIDAWMKEHAGELGAMAHHWFEVMRKCADEVRELLHDGYPVACLGDAPFGYVNVFTSHVNVGFFHGAALPDPARLLQGTGKFMRHVKPLAVCYDVRLHRPTVCGESLHTHQPLWLSQADQIPSGSARRDILERQA